MRVAAIVLAAGKSQRMGDFKQLLPIAGRTVIETVADRISKANALAELSIIVVVGHRAREVEDVLHAKGVVCVVNERYREGMVTSVQCGVQAAGEIDGYAVLLGDQPDLQPIVIEQVIAQARVTGAGIVIPIYGGKRGHPVYISSKYRGEILSLKTDQGLNVVTRGHRDDTTEFPVEGPEVLEDMDTPSEYARIAARLADSGLEQRPGETVR